MKSILISIKPKWVAKILNYEKFIEIRKTMPKCDLPIDVYIYCTKDLKSGKKVLTWLNEKGLSKVKTITYLGNDILGKVVAKFTLRKVVAYPYINDKYDELIGSCLSEKEIIDYSTVMFNKELNYRIVKTIYAWHIDNLVIFDKSKELSEFIQSKRKNYEEPQVQKAPQSWCYVEVE